MVTFIVGGGSRWGVFIFWEEGGGCKESMKSDNLDCSLLCEWMLADDDDQFPLEVREYLMAVLNRIMCCSVSVEDFKWELDRRSVRSVLLSKYVKVMLAKERKRQSVDEDS